MTKLEKLVEEIKKVATDADRNPEDMPPNTRGGWTVRIKEARTALEGLKLQYSQLLLDNAVGICLVGERAREIGEYAEKHGEAFLCDAGQLYERIANFLEPAVSDRRMWTNNHNLGLYEALAAVMDETGSLAMDRPAPQPDQLVPDHESLVALVRRAIRDTVGDSLNRTYLCRKIVDDAFKIRYIEKLTPVIVLNAVEGESIGSAFAKGSYRVLVEGDGPPEALMNKAFKEVQAQIRKNK